MTDSDFAVVVQEEVLELLEELEETLLELEDDPTDLDKVSSIFRIMHTIKGSGSMAGFDQVADFTHRIETILDKVRNGKLDVCKKLIDLVLESRDQITNLIAAEVEGKEVDLQPTKKIIAGLEELLSAGSTDSFSDSASTSAETRQTLSDNKEQLTHYYIHFEAGPSFFDGGGNLEQFMEMLYELGESTIVDSKEVNLDGRQDISPLSPFLDILLTTSQPRENIEDVFLFTGTDSSFTVTLLGNGNDNEIPKHKLLGEILIERGKVSKEDLQVVLLQQKPLGELLVESNLVKKEDVQAALVEQTITKKSANATARQKANDNVKVNADKLDYLVNLVGELVVLQSRLTQFAADSRRGELQNISKDMERLTSDMRDSVLEVRMLPIGTTFSRFKRLVRDLSAELGKEVEMVTEGAETELDKSVIDKLAEPLVHIIRNSIDHGIEEPKDRQAAGKPAKGTVKLAAMHAGAKVILSISDDGKGLDPEVIRKKALEKGIINAETKISREDTFKLLFAPGFSTATKVSNVSGRGVGMDVVQKTIEGELKGTVRISSKKGGGTVISIALPLTLAIIDGLLVKAGKTHFVLPLASVEKCVELDRKDVDKFHGRKVFAMQDQVIPYVRLRDFFKMPGNAPALEQMVIAHVEGKQVGFVLDEVIGGHQTVIKNLGWAYRNAEGVSGATILGNGEVALIIDLPAITHGAQNEETAMVVNL